MVRSLVGALLDVGRSRRPADRPASLLDAGGRASEIMVAPAHGLTMTGVDYPTDDLLAQRAERTRQRRTATR